VLEWILPPNIICERSKLLGLIPAFTGFQNNHRRPNIFFQISKRAVLLFEKHYFDLAPNAKFCGAKALKNKPHALPVEVCRWFASAGMTG